jgi:Uma2 family endonuclease
MASPTPEHQEISGNLFLILAAYIKQKKLGKVYFAPLDTRFDNYNVFQPDLLFISNERKSIIQKRIEGAPDLVVEILSSKPKIDLVKKKAVYGKHGVSEYWVINPKERSLKVFVNEDGKMAEKQTVVKTGNFESKTLKGFSLVVESLFENIE